MIKVRSKQWKNISVPQTDNFINLLNVEEIKDYDNVGNEGVKKLRIDENNVKRKHSKQRSPKNSKKYKQELPKSVQSGKQKSPNIRKRRKQKLIKNKETGPLKATSNMRNSEATNTEQFEDMDSWKPFCIPNPILKALSEKGFNCPTEIQSLCLPDAMFKKKDVFGAAETGSGKTLAFGIPIVSEIVEDNERNGEGNERAEERTQRNDKLWALIVAPTRELVVQVKSHLQDLCKYVDVQIVEVIGGMSVEKQDRKLSKCPHIVVGTPGRLWQLICGGNEFLSSHVDNIRFLVIDEADRMMEKSHFAELQCLLERLNGEKRKYRQTFIFSATLALVHEPPNYIMKKRNKKRKQELQITPDDKLRSFVKLVGARNPSLIDVTKKNVVPNSLEELCVSCMEDDKDFYLLYILKKHRGRKIVFCNSIGSLRRLGDLLNKLEMKPLLLFSHMDQKRRLTNLERYKNDENRILLATDVAARGLDIPQVEYVIHYHVPKTSEIYVHRSGRTARGMNTGITVLLSSPPEMYHYNKMRSTLGKGEFASYNIDSPHVLNALKKQVTLARNIIKMNSKLKSVTDNANWIERCAKEMDLLLDEDDLPKKAGIDEQKQYKQMKNMNAQLKKLMNQPILPYHLSPRFPSYKLI